MVLAPWVTFYIGLYREKHEKIFLLKTHKACGLDIWYEASPSKPLPTSTKFVTIIFLGPKIVMPRGHMFYIDLYREKHEKIFLLKTTRPVALIFGMKHHLVNLYQVCYSYIPGA